MTARTLASLGRERYVSLTTFRRDGTAVSTPVWVVGRDGELLVSTGASTWKVRRIRRDSRVRVAACGPTGRLHGAPVEAWATIVEDTAAVRPLLARKYRLTYRLVRVYSVLSRRLRRWPETRSVTIVITAPPG